MGLSRLYLRENATKICSNHFYDINSTNAGEFLSPFLATVLTLVETSVNSFVRAFMQKLNALCKSICDLTVPQFATLKNCGKRGRYFLRDPSVFASDVVEATSWGVADKTGETACWILLSFVTAVLNLVLLPEFNAVSWCLIGVALLTKVFISYQGRLSFLKLLHLLFMHLRIRCRLQQARSQLGTPGGAKGFLRGAQIFELCPIVLNHVQHIFPGGAKIFLGGIHPPWLRAWVTGLVQSRKEPWAKQLNN